MNDGDPHDHIPGPPPGEPGRRRRRRAISWARVVAALAGLGYLAAGSALLAFPEWFFDTLEPFAPYNRHALGDLGAYLLPVGSGLLAAAARPARYWSLLLLGLTGAVIHVANHLYDTLLLGTGPWRLLGELPLVLPVLLLGWAAWVLARAPGRRSS